MRAWLKLAAMVLAAAAVQGWIDLNVDRLDEALFTARLMLGSVTGHPMSDREARDAADRLCAREYRRNNHGPTPAEVYAVEFAGADLVRLAAEAEAQAAAAADAGTSGSESDAPAAATVEPAVIAYAPWEDPPTD